MKKLLSITLILFVFSSYVIAINKEKNLKKEEKMNAFSAKHHKKNEDQMDRPTRNSKAKNGTSAGAPSNASGSSSSAALKKGVNSLGVMIETIHPIIVNKYPYSLDRCDQIVTFSTDYIPDVNDFTVRKKGFFTMSAYHLNRLTSKSLATLDQIIVLANQRIKPSEPQGAQYCILIDGGNYEKPMLVCGKNDEEKNVYLDLLEQFNDCRKGKSIGEGSLEFNEKIPGDGSKGSGEVKAACGFDGPMADPDTMIAELEGKEKPKDMSTDNEGFWVPGGFTTPGAPIEEEKKKNKKVSYGF
jgi:hypothetical protein